MSSDPKSYQFNLPSDRRPKYVALNEEWYPGVKAYWAKCTSKRSVDPIYGVVAVVVHATAGSSSEGAISVMKSGGASFHWLVPDENEPQHGSLVWACAPEARAAWHVRTTCSHPDVNGGKAQPNHWSLGIEIVNAQGKTGDPFSDWQVEATAQIVRYCWEKYPNLKHVVSHAKLDPKRREDPGKHFDWDGFQDLVLSIPDDEPPALVSGAPSAATIEEAAVGVVSCM